jgi:hypothetical protein
MAVMAENYIPQHAAVEMASIPSSPYMEFGSNFADAVADPATQFLYDKHIGQYQDMPALQTVELPNQPIVVGSDWNEQPGEGMYHGLNAVFNYRGENYGIATTSIDDRPFTYITRFGETGDQGQIVYTLDDDEPAVQMYDHSDKIAGEPSAVLTLRRNLDGKLELTNESLEPVLLGTAYPEQESAANRRGGFGLKNVLHGVKRALGMVKKGNPDDKRRYDSRLSSKMAWKPQSYEPLYVARAQREQDAQLLQDA